MYEAFWWVLVVVVTDANLFLRRKEDLLLPSSSPPPILDDGPHPRAINTIEYHTEEQDHGRCPHDNGQDTIFHGRVSSTNEGGLTPGGGWQGGGGKGQVGEDDDNGSGG